MIEPTGLNLRLFSLGFVSDEQIEIDLNGTSIVIGSLCFYTEIIEGDSKGPLVVLRISCDFDPVTRENAKLLKELFAERVTFPFTLRAQ